MTSLGLSLIDAGVVLTTAISTVLLGEGKAILIT